MPRNKDPAVLFYPADFIAATVLWNNEEIGRYIKLLCIQFLQDGLTKDELDSVAGDSDKIKNKFLLCDDGMYRNPRMTEEKEKRSKFSESRRANANKRYDSTRSANGMQVQSICNASAEHMINGNINRNINSVEDNKSTIITDTNKESAHAKNEAPQRVKKSPQRGSNEVDKVEMRFAQFWQQYPKKVAKVDARKAFMRLNPDDELLGVMLSALERHKASEGWTKDGGRFIPYPSTWINQRRWEDEIDTTEKSPPARFSECSPEDAFMQALNRTYGG